MVARLVKRFSLPALVAFLAGVLAIAASSSILAWSYRDQVHELKATLYERCVQGVGRAEALKVALDGLGGYYDDLVVNLHDNPSPQAQAFNDRLLERVKEVRHKLAEASELAVPASCDVYR